MTEPYRLTRHAGKWHILARKGAGAATEAAWVSVGGCPDQIVAVRVWLALMVSEGRP